jgi:hypothetical protein
MGGKISVQFLTKFYRWFQFFLVVPISYIFLKKINFCFFNPMFKKCFSLKRDKKIKVKDRMYKNM